MCDRRSGNPEIILSDLFPAGLILKGRTQLRVVRNDTLRITKRDSDGEKVEDLLFIMTRADRPVPELTQNDPGNACLLYTSPSPRD